MLTLADNVFALPAVHGKSEFSIYLRELLLVEKFDRIIIQLPYDLCEEMTALVEKLPEIFSLLIPTDEKLFLIPGDPSDYTIEIIRQSLQYPNKVLWWGDLENISHQKSPWLPDPSCIRSIGFEAYFDLCRPLFEAVDSIDLISDTLLKQYHQLKTRIPGSEKILWTGSFFDYLCLEFLFQSGSEPLHISESTKEFNPEVPAPYLLPVHPDHLYFILGEIPFFTGELEKNRYQISAPTPMIQELIKKLFITTRDHHLDQTILKETVSTGRIQTALKYLRNLSLIKGHITPDLLDIVTSGKGVFGDAFAWKIFAAARYYPFFNPLEESYLRLGPHSLKRPQSTEVEDYENLFQESSLEWRNLPLKYKPEENTKKSFRYAWHPGEMCSHIPEDFAIESFNSRLRNITLQKLNEEHSSSEPFSASLKDGLDLRATLRNPQEQRFYVREDHPGKGGVDAVVVIFDDQHDDKYPFATTWYAEHQNESTLLFYGTDPFSNLVGPGIAKCFYGGFALLFPPRYIPDPFQQVPLSQNQSHAETLCHAVLKYSKEKNVTLVSANPPHSRLRNLARTYQKNWVHFPLSRFSMEKLEMLRQFHVLNGKEIRSIANRFIGD